MGESVLDKVSEWQKRLRLMDWGLEVKYALPRDFKTNEHIGSCCPSPAHKTARIQILPKHMQFPPEDSVNPRSEENTLVHELLHIHFAFLDDWVDEDPLREIALEQAINAIADALVPPETK